MYSHREKAKFQPVFLGNAKNAKAYRISLKPVPGLAERMSVTHASSVFCKDIHTKVLKDMVGDIIRREDIVPFMIFSASSLPFCT